MSRRPPRSTRTDTRFPETTPFRSAEKLGSKLVAAVEGLRVGVSNDPDAAYGPVVGAEHKRRIENHIQSGVDEGAELVVDGRGFSLQGHEQGYFLAPTLFDHVTPRMQSYREEIFGPVLQIVRARCREQRSEEHTSELQSLMRLSYAVFCLKKKTKQK